MKNSTDTIALDNYLHLEDPDYALLNRYIGQGDSRSLITFFGNEPGCSEVGVLDTIEKIKHTNREDIEQIGSGPNRIGSGFLLKESYAHPVKSAFSRYISKLMLAFELKDDNWFNKDLGASAKVMINNYIMKPMSEKNYCLVNLRPLPRPTQDTWAYSNINKKDYNRNYNFNLKRHYSDKYKEERLEILKTFFTKSKNALTIGVGDKENKKKFFENIFPNCDFLTAQLGKEIIYYEPTLRIILSGYFNDRNGIKLEGLKNLYNFIIQTFQTHL